MWHSIQFPVDLSHMHLTEAALDSYRGRLVERQLGSADLSSRPDSCHSFLESCRDHKVRAEGNPPIATKMGGHGYFKEQQKLPIDSMTEQGPYPELHSIEINSQCWRWHVDM